MKYLKHISSVFNEIAESKAGMGKRIAAVSVLNLWSRALGSNISRFGEPVKLEGGILSVLTASSSWATELSFLKKEIADKLNNAAGAAIIKDIRFKIGKLEKFSKPKNESINPPKEESPDILERLRGKIINSENDKIKKSWKRCKICGCLFEEKGESCFFCQKDIKDTRSNRIIKILNSTPWIKYSEIKSEIPGLTDEEYKKVKKVYKMRIRLELDTILRYIKRNKINPALKRAIKDAGSKFIFLDKEISPESFDVSQLKKVIGDKAFAVVEGGLYGKKSKVQ